MSLVHFSVVTSLQLYSKRKAVGHPRLRHLLTGSSKNHSSRLMIVQWGCLKVQAVNQQILESLNLGDILRIQYNSIRKEYFSSLPA